MANVSKKIIKKLERYIHGASRGMARKVEALVFKKDRNRITPRA